MNERVKGIVEKINENASGYFGVKMGETWYGAGKFAPKFNEGDEVSFTFSMNGKYANMDFKSVEVLAAGNGSSGEVLHRRHRHRLPHLQASLLELTGT